MTELALHGLSGLRSGARSAVSAWILIPAIPVAVAALDPARFGDILHIAIDALVETLPFVAVAVMLIAASRRPAPPRSSHAPSRVERPA